MARSPEAAACLRRGAAEQFVLPLLCGVMGALRGCEHGFHGSERARTVRLERIEGAGGGQAFQHALVHRARIDAAGEVGQIGERLCSPRAVDDRFHRLRADALQRRERIDDRVAVDLEIPRRNG